MKQLLAGVVLLFVIGIASFLYRNTVERPGILMPPGGCTMETRVCPDGTSVGRTGPACAFAPCALPNVEIPDAGVSFVLPAGYAADEDVYVDDRTVLLASFSRAATLDWPPHAIVVRRYPIGEGQLADDIILANTRYQPEDELASDFSRFRDIGIAGKTFRETTVERFEGLVHTSYFLVRESDVLRFDVSEKGVQGWTEPAFEPGSLPEHQALLAMLASLEVIP